MRIGSRVRKEGGDRAVGKGKGVSNKQETRSQREGEEGSKRDYELLHWGDGERKPTVARQATVIRGAGP